MTVSPTAPRWVQRYSPGLPATISPPYDTMLDVFGAAVEHAHTQPAIRYFDATLSFGELDELSDALACALLDQGFAAGDRLALFVQNDPGFVIGLIAAWKAGGTAVTVNPMNKTREVTALLTDSGAVALLCLDTLYDSVVRPMIDDHRASDLRFVVTTAAADFQHRNDSRVIDESPSSENLSLNRLTQVLARYRGQRPPAVTVAAHQPAVLTYTSGTTGIPKAGINTHSNIAFNAETYRTWMGLTDQDAILAIAPLFHITGLVGHIAAGMAAACPVILTHRFHPRVVLEAIAEHRPTFTVAAITALNSLLTESDDPAADFSPLRVIFSGGAPIAPATAEDFRARTGRTIHNCYGMTETTSPTHATPLGATAPIDPHTGALSIGVPVFNTRARVLDDNGHEVAPGTVGEITVSGPQVVPGYWNRPEETAAAIIDGELHTGDVGYMNTDGWFFVIDRKKDMINASGYKVWPREVEDVLCAHPDVFEAAVVGVPDPYRGETVKAFVVLKAGATGTAEELIRYCRANMAAYKYPRDLEIMTDLPKTLSGKILRRDLRATGTSEGITR